MALTPLTGQDLINEFEKYTDDTTELSSSGELTLVNKIYRKILSSHVWIFLQKNSGNLPILSDGIVSYVTLPNDFDYLPITSGDTDTGSYGLDKTIYTVDANGNFYPYKIINFTDAREYKNKDQYAYIDMANNRIVFTFPPTNSYANFTYIYSPDDLTLATSPVFPAKFHVMIYHGMILDDYIIQISDKARTYAAENKQNYDEYMDMLSSWNSQFYAQ